jgi:hypothetical protein
MSFLQFCRDLKGENRMEDKDTKIGAVETMIEGDSRKFTVTLRARSSQNLVPPLVIIALMKALKIYADKYEIDVPELMKDAEMVKLDATDQHLFEGLIDAN